MTTMENFRVGVHTKIPTIEEFVFAQMANQPPPEPKPIPVVSEQELAYLQRAKAATQYKDEYAEAVAEYNALVPVMSQVLRKIFVATTKYSELTKQQLGVFDQRTFSSINIPVLGKEPLISSGCTTTQHSMEQYNHYRSW